jgi:DNA polymerase-3 subunit gamma/tau
MAETGLPSETRRHDNNYVVVARRYRPKSFDDLVGQQHISQALSNAIETNRVGHAYLFTGARGVGKTSTARIFAKALNAPDGPTTRPDNSADICQAIDAGEDVDVLEIDGASNRGIDEIRQLRSNANVRPSRARYKIYIIDEVHMLTMAAFNALLKTLEEPPEHVKFILCTTDPQKIPITVLSRCQRYDFAPVEAASIVERLQLIVRTEGREAEGEALELLARRAAGSMRDSQSLLEQLLAFSSGVISAADVHQMLGTAEGGRLTELLTHLVARDAGQALATLDRAVADGVDCGQFAEQLLVYFRDLMAVSVGCSADLLQQAGPADVAELKAASQQLGLPTILAATQILDQALVRMRQSTDPRVLLEVALVHVCNLEDLTQLEAAIQHLGRGSSDARAASARPAHRRGSAAATSAAPTQKKTAELTQPPPSPHLPTSPGGDLTAERAAALWKQVVDSLEDMTADFASYYDSVAISAPDRVAVRFCTRYTLHKESCEQPERKSQLEQALSQRAGRSIRIDFEVIPDQVTQSQGPAKSRRQLMREKEDDPLVQKAVDLFGGEVLRVDLPRGEQ